MTENHVEVLIDGHRMLASLLADIEAAERFVHVSMFLFFRDPIGIEIAAALSRKAKAGVKVRVLLNIAKTAMADPFSTGEKQMMEHDPGVDYDPLDVTPLCESMRAAGAEVLDTNIDYDAEPPTADARLRSLAAQINDSIAIDDLHVDHRKLVIIDGRIGYCGGANIGAQYMHHVPFDPRKPAREEAEERKTAGLSEPWWKWHDSLTRFEGPVVTVMDGHFRDRFVLDGGVLEVVPQDAQLSRDARVYCNEPNDKPNEVRELYLRLIAEARRSIFIENPYLYQPAIVEALVVAKKTTPELDVVLILPAGEHNDNVFAQDAQEHEYVRYLECGIEVHEYQNHFTHLKAAVFDERWSVHGSTNLNCRSLEDDKDFELVVLVDSEAVALSVLENVRDVDRRHARRIGDADLHGTIAALRRRVRDPRTLLMLAKRLL